MEMEQYFYDKHQFDWFQQLEHNFADIKSELNAIIDQEVKLNPVEPGWLAAHPHYVKGLKDVSWKTLEFMFFGIKKKSTIEKCPKTFNVLQSIPGLVTAQFSVMQGKTHIEPHKGYSKMVLRSHLGLIVPFPDECGIRVGTTVYHWKEGEMAVFDDSYEHEAWNHSEVPRAVLMFDFVKPGQPYSRDEICRYKIEKIDDPFLLQIADKKEWLGWFEKGYFPEG